MSYSRPIHVPQSSGANPKTRFPLHAALCLYLGKRWQSCQPQEKHSTTHYTCRDGTRRLLKMDKIKTPVVDYFPPSSSLPKPWKPGPGRGREGVRTGNLVPVPADGSVLFTAVLLGHLSRTQMLPPWPAWCL